MIQVVRLPSRPVNRQGATIDPDGTRRFDDAFFIQRVGGGYRLELTIPNTATYDLSTRQQKMSLLKGWERKGLTFIFTINAQFKVESLEFSRSAFRVSENLTYADFELARSSAEHPLHQQVLLLIELAEGLSGGQFEYEGPRGIVAVIMKLLNSKIAEFSQEHNLPMVYCYTIGDKIFYSITPGVFRAFPVYLRITSPLRRDEDHLNLKTLFNFLIGKEDPDARDRALAFIELANREGREIERQLELVALARRRFQQRLFQACRLGTISRDIYEEFILRFVNKEFSTYSQAAIFSAVFFGNVQGECHENLFALAQSKMSEADNAYRVLVHSLEKGRVRDFRVEHYTVPGDRVVASAKVQVGTRSYSVVTPSNYEKRWEASRAAAAMIMNEIITDLRR